MLLSGLVEGDVEVLTYFCASRAVGGRRKKDRQIDNSDCQQGSGPPSLHNHNLPNQICCSTAAQSKVGTDGPCPITSEVLTLAEPGLPVNPVLYQVWSFCCGLSQLL